MIIQNEYCNGGSLSDMINQYRSSGKTVLERDLKQIMVQVAKVCNELCIVFSRFKCDNETNQTFIIQFSRPTISRILLWLFPLTLPHCSQTFN